MESKHPNQALIAAARGGDRMAFAALVEKHEEALAAHIRRQAGKRLQGKLEIEDLLQDALLRAFRSIGTFEGGTEAMFLAWLRTIADHVVVDQVRKLKAGKGVLEREVSLEQRRGTGSGDSWELEEALAARTDSPSHTLRKDERFERLKRVLHKLKPEHEKVILLARVQGLPIREVARRMDRTPEATSMLLLRALLKLKAAFGETESFHLPDRSIEAEGDHHGD